VAKVEQPPFDPYLSIGVTLRSYRPPVRNEIMRTMIELLLVD
jgi:hypothetical protein